MVQDRDAHLVREGAGRVEPVLIEGVQARRRARAVPAAVFRALSTTITNRLKRNGLTVFARRAKMQGVRSRCSASIVRNAPVWIPSIAGGIGAVGRQENGRSGRARRAVQRLRPERAIVYGHRVAGALRVDAYRCQCQPEQHIHSDRLMCGFPAPHWHLLAQGSFSSIDADQRTRRWRLGQLSTSSPTMLVCLTAASLDSPAVRARNAVSASAALVDCTYTYLWLLHSNS